MSAPTRLIRPPSVEDYERMTQAARLSAARLVEEQLTLIEQRRAALRAASTENVGTLVRGAARIALNDLEPVAPDVALARQQVLYEATTPRKAVA